MRVPESKLIDAIVKVITEDLDADDFARIAGEILGGECFVVDFSGMLGKELQYDFTPNENYAGALDKIN
jgi:hypothetical protein